MRKFNTQMITSAVLVLRRSFLTLTCLATAGMLFTAAPALAQHPQFNRGPSATCGGTGGLCLVVDFKVTGLGNVSETNYSLACTSVTVTGQCFTKSGKPVSGTTKSGTASGSNSGTLPVSNGNTTGPITLCAGENLTFNFNPGCTGSQTFVIQQADYSACTLTVDGISADALSASCPA